MNPSHPLAPLRLLLIALFLSAVATTSLALDPSRSITQYVRTEWEDRLPHSTVRAILQGRDGFLWIGTYEGLVRFDGAEFVVFDRRNTALSTSAISALTEDASGRLWVGTVGGGLYRFDGQKMISFNLGPLGLNVSALTADPSGDVWVTTRSGLGRIRGDKLDAFEAGKGLPFGLIWSIRSTAPGEVWVGTEGGGLAHFRDGAFEVLTEKDGLSSNVVYSLASTPNGDLFIGTKAGLDVRKGGHIGSALPPGSLLDKTPAFALLNDRDGNLWVSGGKRGLCRLSGGTLTCEPLDPTGRDLIRTFAEDREGNVWVGGTNRGLWQIRDGKVATITGEQSTNYARSVAQDTAGTVWVGTDGSGVNVVRDGTLVPMEANSQLPSPFVRAIHPDHHGNLWVGTIGGLARVRGGSTKVYTTHEGLTSDIVYALNEARDGTMWVGTSAGLNRVVEERLETLPFRGDVRALLEDHTGRTWIGQRDALSCLDHGRVTDCSAPPALRDSTIFSFHEDREGTVWIGSNHGIARYRDGHFTSYANKDGLFDDNVFQILEDDRGSFWMSSNLGIWQLLKSDFADYDRRTIPALRSTSFGKSDGMGATQCNGASQPAGWKSSDGRLWFPTVKGVVMIDPARLRTNPLAPPVVVESVIVNSKVASPRLLEAVPPSANRFEFHYGGLSFVAPDRVRFKYKLEGFDRDWIDAGTRRVAYYTNLPHGDLRFRVTAANSDGVWNAEGATVNMTTEPRLMDTLWFRALAVLVLAAALFGAYRLRVGQLRRREQQLVILVNDRTEALRAANAELERLASVDGLTLIPNRRAFDERLTLLWNDHLRRRSPMALILGDVDYFKRFNDSHGHIAGDATLTAVAQAIDSTVRRSSDFAARYGGEEFVVLLADTTGENAVVVGELILANIRALQIPHGDSTVDSVVTLSAGLASVIPSIDSSAEELLNAADEALYRAKEAGRNRLVAAEVPGKPNLVAISS